MGEDVLLESVTTGRALLAVPTVWSMKVVVLAVSVTGADPVPVRLTTCGLPKALSATVT